MLELCLRSCDVVLVVAVVGAGTLCLSLRHCSAVVVWGGTFRRCCCSRSVWIVAAYSATVIILALRLHCSNVLSRICTQTDRRGDGDHGPVGEVAARPRAGVARRGRRGAAALLRGGPRRARRGRRGADADDRARAPAPAHLRALRDLPQAAAPDQQGARRDLPGRPAAAAQEVAARPPRHERGGQQRRRRRRGRRRGRAAAPRCRRPLPLATKTAAGLAAAAIVTAGAVEVKHRAQDARQGRRDGRRSRRRPAGRRRGRPPAALRAGAAALGRRHLQAGPQGQRQGGQGRPKPEATATATATPTATPSTEQHDSATTELPSETTGATEDGGGRDRPADRQRRAGRDRGPPSPTPTGSPQPAPTPTPHRPRPPRRRRLRRPEPTPTPTPPPAPSPTPTRRPRRSLSPRGR